jgi:hypothetical protein
MKQVIKINEKELHTLISESVKRILREDENIGLNNNMDITSDDEDWGDYNPMDGSLSNDEEDDFEEDFPEDDYENDFYEENDVEDFHDEYDDDFYEENDVENFHDEYDDDNSYGDEDSLIPDTSSSLDRTIAESINRLKRRMF